MPGLQKLQPEVPVTTRQQMQRAERAGKERRAGRGRGQTAGRVGVMKKRGSGEAFVQGSADILVRSSIRMHSRLGKRGGRANFEACCGQECQECPRSGSYGFVVPIVLSLSFAISLNAAAQPAPI